MDLQQQQQAFIDYIRQPNAPLPCGVSFERMQVYRELFFNNVRGFVSNAFPVLKSLYSEAQWQALIRDFFSQHDCQSPIFVEIAQEFMHFLRDEYKTTEIDPPFMLALAHYEWLELEVATAQQDSLQLAVSKAEILHSPLCLAATARVAQYQYPVQQISVDFRPLRPLGEPVSFCVYQDAVGEVRFLHLTPLSAQVLGYLAKNPQTLVGDILHWLTTAYPHISTESITSGCLLLLEQLAAQGIVLTIAQ